MFFVFARDPDSSIYNMRKLYALISLSFLDQTL